MPNSTPPFTGYKPGFEMPIVAPPPASWQGTPLAYYQQLPGQVTLAVSGPNGEFVDIALTKAPNAIAPIDATLFAMTGGFVCYYPSGMTVPSPDGFSDPTNGVLVLTVWVEDITAQQRAFAPGTPPIGRIYYIGAETSQTKTILRVQTAKMSDAALRASWKAQLNASPPAGTTHDQLVDKHNDFVMAGSASVFVDPGTPIGNAMQDSGAPIETYKLMLRMTGGQTPIAYVSPLPSIVDAPYFDPRPEGALA